MRNKASFCNEIAFYFFKVALRHIEHDFVAMIPEVAEISGIHANEINKFLIDEVVEIGNELVFGKKEDENIFSESNDIPDCMMHW